MNKLTYYRKRIDMIDRNIVKLLLSRFKLIKQIANYKKTNKIKIFNKKRELQIMENIKMHSSKKHQKFVTDFFKNIINYSRKLQK